MSTLLLHALACAGVLLSLAAVGAGVGLVAVRAGSRSRP